MFVRPLGLVALCIIGCGGTSASLEAPPAVEDDTSLGSGDVFEVRVHGEDDLTGTYRVSREGTIHFPFIGTTRVAGLEPPQVAERLEQMLTDGRFFANPHVSVLVQEYNSKRISVIGAIAQPGTFPLTPGLTALQAITAAGGFTALAAQNDTVVTRHVDGERRRYRVRAGDVSSGEAADLRLRPGDIVYVPERIF
jgi:polysaccharide export outer membrane protein